MQHILQSQNSMKNTAETLEEEAGAEVEVRAGVRGAGGGKTNRTQQSVIGRITLLSNDAKILPDTREAGQGGGAVGSGRGG